jgi:hypothetical protein
MELRKTGKVGRDSRKARKWLGVIHRDQGDEEDRDFSILL